MPTMMVKPEFMEWIKPDAERLIEKAEKKGEKLTKDAATEEAFELLLRAGVHRQKASRNYAESHKKPAKPRAAKKAKAPKAKKETAPKKAKAPKAKKAKERPAAEPVATPAQAKAAELPTNGGDSMLE